MEEKITVVGSELEQHAKQMRRYILSMINHAGSGHPGGSLSAVEVLAYLYQKELRFQPDNPDWTERDRFILSKGHACPVLYAAAVTCGIIDTDELGGFRKIGAALQGHPDVSRTPWVETSTGSLGQGFSVAIGMAMGLIYKNSEARIYVMLGDGELQEGEVWEGAMCAAHHRLSNLCAIIDYNKMQSDDLNVNIMQFEPLKQKWHAFNWHTIEIDGHDFRQIEAAFKAARNNTEMPTVIISHTIKGKGVSYMEGSPAWHGSVKLRKNETLFALKELDASSYELEEIV
ncbi:MAG: transketolase [Caldithrix sp.]|nr:MAG: transketolase [Caldithrix sp.]